MLYSEAICLVRHSIRAVLPEPTGPATPIFTYDIFPHPLIFEVLSLNFIPGGIRTYKSLNTNLHAAYSEDQIPVLKVRAILLLVLSLFLSVPAEADSIHLRASDRKTDLMESLFTQFVTIAEVCA